MIMEFVEGETLSNRMATRAYLSSEAVNYADQVLSALSYAHKQNIIHRDIKPANMMLTPQGIREADGLRHRALVHRRHAHFHRHHAGLTQLHATGTSARSESADARSDIYSFGISLYELLTGELPVPQSDSHYSLMTAHLNQVPTPPITLRTIWPASLNQIMYDGDGEGSGGAIPVRGCSSCRTETVPVSPLPVRRHHVDTDSETGSNAETFLGHDPGGNAATTTHIHGRRVIAHARACAHADASRTGIDSVAGSASRCYAAFRCHRGAVVELWCCVAA